MLKKYKEPIKTIILCVLLISTFVLSARLWIFEELYSVTDTSDITNILLRRGTGMGPSNTLEERGIDRLGGVFTPLRMIASYEDDRSFVTFEGGAFLAYYEEVKNQMAQMLAGEDVSCSLVENSIIWQRAISENSLFFDYEKAISLRLLCQSLNVPLPKGGDEVEVRYGAIHCDENQKVEELYFKDDQNQLVYVITNGLKDKTLALISKIAQDEKQKKGSYFLFEQEEELNKGTKLGLEPEQVFFERPISQPMIIGLNPLSVQTENKGLVEKNILGVFLYNASTVKKYTALDNSQVFVENFSTLRIDTEGLIEYHATQNDKGIALFSGNQVGAAILSRYDIIRSTYQMLFSLGREVLGGEGDLKYYGMEYLADKECYRLYFGYTYGNYEIIRSWSEQNKGYPICIDVADGYVTDAVIFAQTFYFEGGYREQQPHNLVLDMLLYSNYSFPVKGLDERYVYQEDSKNLYLSYGTQP
jgi:hypothetical protein